MTDATYPQEERVSQRRRLRYKQTVPELVFAGDIPLEVAMDEAPTSAEGSHAPSEARAVLPVMIPDMPVRGHGLDVPEVRLPMQRVTGFPRAVYNRVYGRMGRWVHAQQNQQYVETWDRHKLRRAIGESVNADQRKLIEAFLRAHVHLGEEERRFLEQIMSGVTRQMPGCVMAQQWKRFDTKLFTHNGPWGLVPASAYVVNAGDLNVHVVAQALQVSAWFAQLRDAFVKFVSARCSEVNIKEWVWSAEICPSGIRAVPAVCRVHFHVAVRGVMQQFRQYAEAHFRGTCGFAVPCPVAHGSCTQRGYQAFLYVQARKIGQIASGGSVDMCSDYAIQPDWVLLLLQSGKIDLPEARRLAIRAVRNLPQVWSILDAVEREQNEARLQLHVSSVQKALAAERFPFKILPEVVAWNAGFTKLRSRYKFLVLDGPSQAGKSEYARSLASPGCAFFVDCGKASEPDLRSFVPLTHEVIVMDEATPAFVVANKRVFQAPADWVRLGQSPTNAYSYRVWIHGAKIVVSTNDWRTLIRKLSVAESEWISANCVYVPVVGELFDRPL